MKIWHGNIIFLISVQKSLNQIFSSKKQKNTLPMVIYSGTGSHWGHTSNINKLLTLQKWAIRLISNKPYNYHTEPLFKDKHILKIPDLYKVQVSLFVHVSRSTNLPSTFENFLGTPSNIQINTRQYNIIYKPSTIPRTKFSSQLPSHKFISIWNNLDRNLRTTTSRSTFKNNLTNQILQEYSSYIHCQNPACKYCHT